MADTGGERVSAFEEYVPASADGCADPLGDPFLRTRFALPTRPGAFLQRRRLNRHLDQALGTPLTMVNGSAGAGKTLLVADWAVHLDRPVAWLTLESEEQRPGMFWAYLLQALRVCGMPLSDPAAHPADAGSVDHRVLSAIAGELNDRDQAATVVLDEYDRVSAPEVAEQLEFVLNHAGDGLRLILVTRTEPMLPLHRYRVAGALTEIRGAELAFTPKEALALLEVHGLCLPLDAARALVDRTRGWAAGLRLCALAALESPDPETYLKEFEADRSTVADFLLAEVLKRQTEQTEDLLLRASVLERFCPDLVNALTERTDAERILARLHRENAFVEDLGHSWYRLHPLFGEILRAHLRERCPGLEPELHRRAALWLQRSGSLPETLAHGAAAGDWDFTAGALVDDLAIGQFFTGLRSEDLTRLFSRMEPDATSPATELVRAARDLSRSDLDRGLAHLHHAEERLTGELSDPAAAQLSCALLEALAARLTGSPAQAEEAAESADEAQQDVPAHLLDKHPELRALLMAHLGTTRLWAGRFEEAQAALSTVVRSPGGVSTLVPREDSMGHLALIDYLNGWPGRAEDKALEAVSETERLQPRPPLRLRNRATGAGRRGRRPQRTGPGPGPPRRGRRTPRRDTGPGDGRWTGHRHRAAPVGPGRRASGGRGGCPGGLHRRGLTVGGEPRGTGRLRRPPRRRTVRNRRRAAPRRSRQPAGVRRGSRAPPPRRRASGCRDRPPRQDPGRQPHRSGRDRPGGTGESAGRVRRGGLVHRPRTRSTVAHPGPARAVAPALPRRRTVDPPSPGHRTPPAVGRGLARARHLAT